MGLQIIDEFIENKILPTMKEINGFYNFQNIEKNSIIGIYGLHGGIGVSSFIHELCYKLSQETDNKILIIDGNYLFPKQRIYGENKKFNNFLNINFKESLQTDTINKCITKITNMDNVFLLGQHPVSMMNLIQNDSKILYNHLQNLLNALIKQFNIILIDLNIYLLCFFIEQILLKNCSLLIELSDNSLDTILNQNNINDVVRFTIDNNIFENRLIIKNKTDHNSNLYLPYENNFNEIYNSAGIFLKNGREEKNYSEAFNNVYKALMEKINDK